MTREEVVHAIVTLLIQTENGYHLSKHDLERAEKAINIAKQVLEREKQ